MRLFPIAALALALVSAPAAASQLPPGELLFQSDREGPTRLFILDLATKAQRRVGSAGDWHDEEPAWSRDGQRIVFSSTRGGGDNFDIWIMNADGTSPARLTDHPAPERDPVWAHDEQSVFFTGKRDDDDEIYRVWLADKRVERITNGPSKSMMPAVSPDGRYLAYASQVSTFHLFLVELATGTTRQITSGEGACRPSFAPTSQEIAFVRMDEPSRLEAVREEGPRVIQRDTRLWSYYPSYSPDGRYVAFSVSPAHHAGEDWDLAVMDLQKPGAVIKVTTGAGNDRVPTWRPAGGR